MDGSTDTLPPFIWRTLFSLGPDPESLFSSPFVGSQVPRRFHFVWLFVCRREQKTLRDRLENWYSGEFDAAPQSHRPLAARVAIYPIAIRDEQLAYGQDLSLIQRFAHRLLLLSMPFARTYLLELRYTYRFFGVGDDIWVGDKNLGPGRDFD